MARFYTCPAGTPHLGNAQEQRAPLFCGPRIAAGAVNIAVGLLCGRQKLCQLIAERHVVLYVRAVVQWGLGKEGVAVTAVANAVPLLRGHVVAKMLLPGWDGSFC
jgi:hypothetical protein